MKIKAKLTLSIGFLFVLIILLAGLGMREINTLSTATNNILVANYNTLDYTRKMLIALDEAATDSTNAVNKFQTNLEKQKANVTEIGEKELTERLTENFEKLKINLKNESVHFSIRKDLTDIMLLNMQAIERKSNIAKQTATNSTTWISIIGTFCFLVSLLLIFNLPGNIANPIKELTASIKQIAAMNYNERVHFETRDEFGELASSFNVMAEKLQEYNSSNLAKLMFEKKRIEMLINNMHNPVIGFDEKKIILFVNNEALKILGMKVEELIGKPAQDIAVTNDLMRSLVQGLINENAKTHNEKPLKIYADNKESYFEKEIVNISITPTGEKESQHIGQFIVLKNITPFKELDFAKTNFIATISHELKTPISAIKASLQLLESKNTGVINDDQRELILSIKDDSNRLLKIIGELLNLSQVETGNIQLNIQPGDPNQILHYALEAIKTQADQKSIKLNVTADTNLPLVKADTEKTAWVLINLLTNAIRYSNENSEVLIDVKKENDTVRFSVQDFGKGIEDKYKDKIFTRYFQIPGSSKAGTGLGLSISKEFIEAQGGEIMVESEIGKGSKLSFILNT